jgi:hypothetical protein
LERVTYNSFAGAGAGTGEGVTLISRMVTGYIWYTVDNSKGFSCEIRYNLQVQLFEPYINRSYSNS